MSDQSRTITVTIPPDIGRLLDRWTLVTYATDEKAVLLALRIMLMGDAHPPVPLTRIVNPGARGAD